MKLYLKIVINSEGASTPEIIKIAEEAGFNPGVGDDDFVIEFETPEEYNNILETIHKVLAGTKALYTVTTRREPESLTDEGIVV